jgi:hypothetical protein
LIHLSALGFPVALPVAPDSTVPATPDSPSVAPATPKSTSTEPEAPESTSSRLVRIASEGALWGAIKARGLLRKAVIVSDGAGQFDIGSHAGCNVHAERLIHALEAHTDNNRAAKEAARDRFWTLYAGLKAYKQAPSPAAAEVLEAEFDAMVAVRSSFVSLNRLMDRMAANKADLLRVLERPEIPLHNNGSENDIRCHVTRRKVSAGTRSDVGRDCRDAFLGLMKTCAKLGIAFRDYLGARFQIPGAPDVPPLAELIQIRSAADPAPA